MVRSVITERFYCDTCNCEYENEEEATACEAMSLEFRPPYAEVGQEIVSDFFCGYCRIGYTVGVITEIEGPVPADEDIEHRLIQIQGRVGVLHVYYLHVKAPCPLCKRELPWIKVIPQIRPNKRF